MMADLILMNLFRWMCGKERQKGSSSVNESSKKSMTGFAASIGFMRRFANGLATAEICISTKRELLQCQKRLCKNSQSPTEKSKCWTCVAVSKYSPASFREDYG